MIEASQAARGPGWDYSATTASDGSYALFGLPADDYVVRATALGYAREYWDNVAPFNEATMISVSAGVVTPGIDFVLTEGGSLSGHVYQSDGMTPIAGARVFVRPSKYFFDAGFWATTDIQGAYQVESLSLGNFRVMAEAVGYARSRYYDGAAGLYPWESAAAVPVIPPSDTPNIDINLQRAGSISGHIYRADGSTPIPGLVIGAQSIGPYFDFGSSPSNADGYYVIEGLPPGGFLVRAWNPPGLASRWYNSKPDLSSADAVTVAEGEAVAGKDFLLEIGSPLRGHVYDEEGEPISGVIINAHLPASHVVSSALTDSLGGYEIWLGTGDYVLEAFVVDHWVVAEWYDNHYDKGNADPVHVEAPNPVSGIDFHLAKAGSISGHVYEADGATPIANASLYAFPLSGDHPGAGANSGPDGSYTIEGLPSGGYKVQVTVSDHVAQYYNNAPDKASATEVKVNAPADVPGVDFRLSRASQ